MVINPLIYQYLNLDLYFLNLTEQELLDHYSEFGCNENRIVSEEDFFIKFPSFDFLFYKHMNEDLVDYNKYMLMGHYFAFGYNEGRMNSEEDFIIRFPSFDLLFYKSFYEDLLDYNKYRLMSHYYHFGLKERRFSSEKDFYDFYPTFDLLFYKSFYEDLFDYNKYKLMSHYYHSGLKEGRFICEKDFYDFYSNFDLLFYKSFYEDLLDYNKYSLMSHYYHSGSKEKRFICEKDFYDCYPTFDLLFYKNFYQDLVHHDKYKLMSHYYHFGLKEGRVIYEKILFEKYPNLFHKYLLNLSNPHQELSYNIISSNNVVANFVGNFVMTHIHIYDIGLFDDIFGIYFDNLCEFSPIIITFSVGSISSDLLLTENIYLLQIPNKGMDIGGKLCAFDFLEKNNITYDYLFFLHSKSNKAIRDSYFLPFFKNRQRLQLIRTLLSVKNNKLYGLFHPYIHSCDFNDINILDNPIKYDKVYLTEMLNFMNIDFDYNLKFSEGNVCILHKSILNYIFKNKVKMIYNILNSKESFDYNWVKINYSMDTNLNMHTKLKDTYDEYIRSKLNGNILTSGVGIRDGMIEHVFERIWIKVIQSMNGNFLLLNENNIFDTFQIKLNAIYFPQFHNSPENNKFWGDGFTEWTLLKPYSDTFNVKNETFDILKPHSSIGYYDLENKNVVKNQIQMAEKYNINGFVIYHYWFKDNKKVLYKPLEYFLSDDIQFPFCISWANETWSRRWDGSTNDLLLEQTYGKENDYLLHIQYLIPFFLKKNYMKNEKGECIFYIYNFCDIQQYYSSMMKVWNAELSKYCLKIDFIITENSFNENHNYNSLSLNKFIFEPMYSLNYISAENCDKGDKYLNSIKFKNFDFDYYKLHNIDVFEFFYNDLSKVFDHFLSTGYYEKRVFRLFEEVNYFLVDYKDIIKNYKNLDLDNYQTMDKKHFGLPLYWNNKVRRKNRYFLHVKNADKSNICYLFNILICRILLRYVNITDLLSIKKKSCNFINVNAWNEWNEQAVLEPNSINGFENLETLYEINHDL